MSVDQLRSFIQSSRQLGHSDKQVADFLRQVKLSNQLDARTVEDLQSAGAGPRTMTALRELSDSSKSLPAPPAPVKAEAPAPIPSPSAEEQETVLKDVRAYAMEYSKSLPNFICTQVTRRFVDPTGMEFWQRQDVVTAKLSYFEQKEDYKVVLLNNRVVETTYAAIGGTTSSGEFGTLMREIFDPASKTQFQWQRWATLRGKRMHVFSYRVGKDESKWSITYERSDRYVPAYQGLIYVDRETLAVMRLTLQAIDMPVSFPVQQATTTLDYDFVKIGEASEFVLPLKAVIRMRSGKLLTRNDVEFRMYRRFGAEATITYTPEPLGDDQTNEQQQQPFNAPPQPQP